MIKKYIHRELVLGELGYDINSDVKKYKDFFEKLIGEHDELIKEEGTYMVNNKYQYYVKGHYYIKGKIPILFYDISHKRFFISRDIWVKIQLRFRSTTNGIKNILCILLEHYLGVVVEETAKSSKTCLW